MKNTCYNDNGGIYEKSRKNRVYKHFKGNYYLLVDTGLDSETLEELVIYRKLYSDGALWIRPLEDF